MYQIKEDYFMSMQDYCFNYFDSTFLSELRMQKEKLREEEKGMVEEEKKERHQKMLDHAKAILRLAWVGRREGLLALEEEAEGLDNEQGDSMLVELISLIVDGTDPGVLQKTVMIKYYSSDNTPMEAIMDLMSIFGCLEIQSGTNPRIIVEQLHCMLPEDTPLRENYFDSYVGTWEAHMVKNIEDYIGGDN